jgi:regulator of sigma E protease
MDILLNAIRFVGVIFLVIVVFNLMILVHEWGHFLAARWRGLKIEKFYIWFGKPLWKKTINGVEYGLGSIPAGGFVALPQMAPMEAIEGRSDEPREKLPPISHLDKIIVAFAGPLFSFLLACFFAVLVWFFGKPEQEGTTTTEIGYVIKDTAAEKAGLKAGDTIKMIDGKPVNSFGGLVDSVRWLVVASEGTDILFTVEREGRMLDIPVKAEKPPQDQDMPWWKSLFTRPPFREVGIIGRDTPMVGDLMDDKNFSPAALAGIKPNDLLLSVDGIPLRCVLQLGEYIETHPGKTLSLEIQRGKETKTVEVTPRVPDQRPKEFDKAMIGIVWDLQGKRTLSHPSPWRQVRDAARTMFQTLGAVFSPKSDVSAQHLSGFIGITRVYYSLFQDKYGVLLVLWFSVVLNVNLAILNMLPFPVLDGGHIVTALIEAVRRRPINIRLLEIVQTACVVMLLGFMVFISLKDTGDIFGAGQKSERQTKKDEVKKEQEVQLKFLAPAAK